jgi:hypothetical protein
MRPISYLIPLVFVAAVGCGGGSDNSINIQQQLPQISINIVPNKAATPVGTVQPFVAVVFG